MGKALAESKKVINELRFKGAWRSYQERVLEELSYHLGDKKLNVVAAPGAGKTTLGIEVMSRLGENSLILAPTITIRNQWKNRIVEGFLPEDVNPDLISCDINNISSITVSTYQALHSIYKNPEDKNPFLYALKTNKVKTLVLDEAHHLRTEWYQTLNNLCQEIEFDTIVSLTGTPPYDVSPIEWANYHSLCGPVDAEISIPELVKNGDLCPHQDLIYFSNLSKEEENIVFDFEKNREEFFKWLNKSSDFMYAILASDFVNDFEKNEELIYKNPGFTISIISYILSVDSLNVQARYLAKFLDLELYQIPMFDHNIAQTLFNGIFGEFEQYFKNIPFLKDKLKELKLLNGKHVDFEGNTDFKTLFARSKNKLDAIFDITKNEYASRKKSLREVVLLDYIGKSNTIGLDIFSVFDKLLAQNIKLGILTGTLIVIPEAAKSELYKILEERKIDPSKILTAKFCDDYLRVETYGEINIVSIITELFEKGEINVLIGTAALLGEGWDSPCVNSLVIASTVGSFMLSNQMRGRALRIDKNNPDKTSNIWHLASITSYTPENSPDFLTIQKRFNTFEGISYADNKIRNGIERFGKILFEPDTNKKMFEYAKDVEELKKRWNQVFTKSEITEGKMISQVYEIVESNTQLQEIEEYHNFISKFIGDVRRRQKLKLSNNEQLIIANCVLKTLCDIGKIETPYEDIELKYYTDSNKNFCITVLNCSNIERNIFIKSYNEVFYLDDNSRYILKITRNKNNKNGGNDIEKYLPVPEYIGSQQKHVKIFVDNLKGKSIKKPQPIFEKSGLHKINSIDAVTCGIYLKFHRWTFVDLNTFIKLIRFNLKCLNKSGALKKKYENIDIKIYKNNNNNLCITCFNCTDYERKLILNNLCEIYQDYSGSRKYSITKGKKDGIHYLVIPSDSHIVLKDNKKEITSFFNSQIWLVQKEQGYDAEKPDSASEELTIRFSTVIAVICAFLLILKTDIRYNVALATIAATFVLVTITFILYCPINLIVKSFKKTKNAADTLIESSSVAIHSKMQNPVAKIKNYIHYLISQHKYKVGLKKSLNIDIIYAKSDKNKREVLKAKYNTYLLADTKRSRVWI